MLEDKVKLIPRNTADGMGVWRILNYHRKQMNEEFLKLHNYEYITAHNSEVVISNSELRNILSDNNY
jgi:hypothetical protein